MIILLSRRAGGSHAITTRVAASGYATIIWFQQLAAVMRSFYGSSSRQQLGDHYRIPVASAAI